MSNDILQLQEGREAVRAYLMDGPWENDPTGRNPGIYIDDPAGGDPFCLCTIKRLYHRDLLHEALLGPLNRPKLKLRFGGEG